MDFVYCSQAFDHVNEYGRVAFMANERLPVLESCCNSFNFLSRRACPRNSSFFFFLVLKLYFIGPPGNGFVANEYDDGDWDRNRGGNGRGRGRGRGGGNFRGRGRGGYNGPPFDLQQDGGYNQDLPPQGRGIFLFPFSVCFI